MVMKRGREFLFLFPKLWTLDVGLRILDWWLNDKIIKSNVEPRGRPRSNVQYPKSAVNPKMNLREQIATMIEPLLQGGNYYLVDVQTSKSRVNPKITVLIDSDTGISIDECGEISRQLDQQMEESALVGGAYTLEVSSPGIEFPLSLLRQYQKNVGRSLKVVKLDGVEKRGILTTVTDEHIVLQQEGIRKKKEEATEFVIQMADIAKAQVQISFK